MRLPQIGWTEGGSLNPLIVAAAYSAVRVRGDDKSRHLRAFIGLVSESVRLINKST